MKKRAAALSIALLFFGMVPFFAAAQTSGERIESGRFGAEEPADGDGGSGSKTYKNHWLFLGARLGPALRIYTPGDDTAFTGGDTLGPSMDAGFQASVQISPLFSVQAETVFTWDNASVWLYAWNSGRNGVDSYTRQFTGFSLQIPVMAKLNFYPGRLRVSPFLGAYVLVPLGTMKVSDAYNNWQEFFSYSFSLPLGLLGGLSAAFPSGPGMIFADIRFTADLGGPKLQAGGEIDTFRRYQVVISAGYEFGFFTKRQTGSAQ